MPYSINFIPKLSNRFLLHSSPDTPDDIVYDECGIDWATIADETEADRLVGRAISYDEFVRRCEENLDHMLKLALSERYAFVESLGTD